MRSRRLFLFFIVDAQGRSAVFENGLLRWQAEPRPLRHSPEGWRETEIAFVRSQRYHGINRQFTNSYKFVEDGADIIRAILYQGQGYETKAYVVVTKWDDATDIYRPYYRGEIDFVKAKDDPKTGVTVNLVEGDLLKLLNANDGTEYEIPLPTDNLVQLDGVSLESLHVFGQFEDSRSFAVTDWILPFTYLYSDGTLVNVDYNPIAVFWTPQIGGDTVFYEDNDNYRVLVRESAVNASTINITGVLPIRVAATSGSFPTEPVRIFAVVADTNGFVSRTEIASHVFSGFGDAFDFPIDYTVTLQPGQRLFISGRWVVTLGNVLQFMQGHLNFNIVDRFRSSIVPVISLKNLCQQLLQRIFGSTGFTLQAQLLDNLPDLELTSGDAIRGIQNPTIKTSFARFFEAVNSVCFAGFGVNGLQCFFEARDFFYNSSVNTMTLSEVSELNIAVDESQLFNTIKAGYPVQDIENLNGRYAFNNTNTFIAPVTKVQKSVDQISPYLSDPYVIESIRIRFTDQPTTDNKGDNNVYFLVTTPGRDPILGVGLAYEGVNGYRFVFASALATEFTVNTYFEIRNSSAGANGSYLCTGIDVQGPFVFIQTSPNQNGNVIFTDVADIYFPKTVLRENYDEIEGLPNLADAYNIKYLTPKRMVLAWAKYYRSGLYVFGPEKIAFSVGDRNTALKTILSGIEIDEDADIRIEDLGQPLFYPLEFRFKTVVPSNFNDVFSAAVNGHIAFTYNGVQFYGFPMQVKVTPGTNEAQEWQVLASPRNDLRLMIQLLGNPLQNIVMASYGLSFSMLNPVQMLPESPTRNPRYHFIHMDAGTFAEQSQRYIGLNPYQQKWQVSDTIKLQCLTRQLGPVRLELVDCNDRIWLTEAMTFVNTPAVQQPYNLFQGQIVLTDVEPGLYWIRCIAGIEGVEIRFISEPQHIAIEHPNTLVFAYSNTKNQAATIFSTGYRPELRVEGNIIDYLPRALTFSYQDEPANTYLLDGTPYRQFTLFIGDSYGLPNYVADKVNRIFSLNTVTIDGKGFVRDEDGQMEPVNRVVGMPGTWWRLNIREAQNLDAITQTDDGGLLEPATVLINVDTAMFGDLTGQASENPVQIEVLNQ